MCDFTSPNNTFMKVVWDFTSHNATFIKGGVRLYITEQYIHEGWGETFRTEQARTGLAGARGMQVL